MLQPRHKAWSLIRQPQAASREDVGSGQLYLSASRLLVPSRHRLGRLSSSAGRQPPWMLLPPHGTHHPYSAGLTALPCGTRKALQPARLQGLPLPLAGRGPCTPGRWQQCALQSAGDLRRACLSMRHVAGGIKRYVVAPKEQPMQRMQNWVRWSNKGGPVLEAAQQRCSRVPPERPTKWPCKSRQ